MNMIARYLKITEKVSFNVASEAIYVYIWIRQKFIKIAKKGQFGEFLNATFWGIFKQCDMARFYVVRYGFLCRTKNDLWVWQKVSQLRVTRLIFHYVLTFCLFFLAYLPTDRKEVFFKVWLGRLHVHIRYRTR